MKIANADESAMDDSSPTNPIHLLDCQAQGASKGTMSSTQPAIWTSLFAFTAKTHAPTLSIALFLTLAAGAVTPAYALFLGKVFDAFTQFGAGSLTSSQLLGKISTACSGLIGLGLGSWLLHGTCFMAWVVFGELQARIVRERLFAELLKKELAWFDLREDGIGALLPRLQT